MVKEIIERIDDSYIIRRNASFENITNLLQELQQINPEYSITFVGDGATKNKETILNYLPNSSFVDNNELCAKSIGILGYRNRFNPDYLKLEPLYLRKSEAEQKMEEKLNAGK